jgi:hypothetical protein
MMRIKYLTENEDYVIKKNFNQLNNEVYKPENYFINNLGYRISYCNPISLDTLSLGQF